ncbi:MULTISPECIES: hypothetical protein [unclassified Mesorhizobium]
MALLLPIPLLWLLFSGLTLHTMSDPQGWLPFSVVGTALAGLVLRRLGR